MYEGEKKDNPVYVCVEGGLRDFLFSPFFPLRGRRDVRNCKINMANISLRCGAQKEGKIKKSRDEQATLNFSLLKTTGKER